MSFKKTLSLFHFVIVFGATFFSFNLFAQFPSNLGSSSSSLTSGDLRSSGIGRTSNSLMGDQNRNFDDLQQTFIGDPINPQEYMLGAGDLINITIMSGSYMNYSVRITPTNYIVIKGVPPIEIQNLKLSDAPKHLETILSTVFRNAKIHVTLLEPRKIKVGFISLGREIEYLTVFSGFRLSEVVTQYLEDKNKIKNTLPSDTLALRSIELYRRNPTQTIYFDKKLYNIEFNDSKNPYLKEGDVIRFSRRIQKTIVSGYVKYPGVYEYVVGDSLYRSINLSGGLIATANLDSVKIIRNSNTYSNNPETIYLNIAGFPLDKNIPLQNNDIVVIAGNYKKEEIQMVSIDGEVKRPGIFGIVKGKTRLMDVIQQAGGLTSDAFIGAAKLMRGSSISSYPIRPTPGAGVLYDDSPEMQYVGARDRADLNLLFVDFQKLLNGDATQNILLQNGDKIVIPKNVSYVTVIGRVTSPGKIEHKVGLQYMDYIVLAGGFTRRSRPAEVLVQKPNSGELIDVSKVTSIDPGDIVLVQEKAMSAIDEFTRTVGIISAISSTISSVTSVVLTYSSIRTLLGIK